MWGERESVYEIKENERSELFQNEKAKKGERDIKCWGALSKYLLKKSTE